MCVRERKREREKEKRERENKCRNEMSIVKRGREREKKVLIFSVAVERVKGCIQHSFKNSNKKNFFVSFETKWLLKLPLLLLLEETSIR